MTKDPAPAAFETPRKLKSSKLRRRVDGSPIIPCDRSLPTKTVILIRHGQSQGQVSRQNGMDRNNDPRLRDCGLTQKGESEAMAIPGLLTPPTVESIQLVMSSPLTRALRTALLGFPTKNILIHYDLREIGSRAPENSPREHTKVLKDLEDLLVLRDDDLVVDSDSLRPTKWPNDHTPNVVKTDRLRHVFRWLYHEREETVIAVVCHYNVIRAAVADGNMLRPRNGTPIFCSLNANGELFVSADQSLGISMNTD